MHKKGSKSLCYISLLFGCWNICRWRFSWATNQQKFDSTNHNLSFYDYELKIIAEMAKTNSIVLPFASKAALSATPIKGQNTKQTKTKIETFILYQYATFILVVLARSASAAFTYLHS